MVDLDALPKCKVQNLSSTPPKKHKGGLCRQENLVSDKYIILYKSVSNVGDSILTAGSEPQFLNHAVRNIE